MLYLGPAVGAYLYDIGGFSLPFLICGSIDTILAAFLLITIPALKKGDSPIETNEEKEENEDINARIEEGIDSNNEKTTLLKECVASKDETCNIDDSVGTLVLGYRCIDILP